MDFDELYHSAQCSDRRVHRRYAEVGLKLDRHTTEQQTGENCSTACVHERTDPHDICHVIRRGVH